MSKTKPNTPEEIIELMQQASKDSTYKITCLSSSHSALSKNPTWNFGLFRYELAKEKPSVDWNHVAPQFKYMATCNDGVSYLFTHKPSLSNGYWHPVVGNHSKTSLVSGFSSYKAGTCHWEDSLVERPDEENIEMDIIEELIN